jgi:uncharacterized protein (TIGR04255 family)
MNPLPDFGRPPVVEVAAALQFAPLRDLTAAHVGLYWAQIREEFGRVNEMAPLARQIEESELGPTAEPQFTVLTQPELPRLWFVSESGTRLIQLQRDRFAYNWRRLDTEEEYPRFSAVKQSFLNAWGGFRRFLDANTLMSPALDQCELTYVNIVPRGDGWDRMSDLERLFRVFRWNPRDGFLGEPESAGWNLTFKLPDDAGRLHVAAAPAIRKTDNADVIRMALTARGAPSANGDKALEAWYDQARVWIVRGFAGLITDHADELWERRQ